MRELAAKLSFVSPCLGNVKKFYQRNGKTSHYYLLPRDPNSKKIIFLPTWWRATLRRAAEILCRHHSDINKVLFSPVVEGIPHPIPREFYRRYYGSGKFTRHEAFFAGDEISVRLSVPQEISDEDMYKLLEYAGKYCGISPAHPNEFGHYEVTSLTSVY